MANKKPLVQYLGILSQVLDADTLVANAGLARDGVVAADVNLFTDALTNKILIGRTGQQLEVQGDLKVLGNLIVVTGTEFDGDVQIGDATTDTLAIVSGIEAGPLAGPNAPLLPVADAGGARELVFGSTSKRVRTVHAQELDLRADASDTTKTVYTGTAITFTQSAGGGTFAVQPATSGSGNGHALRLVSGTAGGVNGNGGTAYLTGGDGGAGNGGGGTIQISGGVANGLGTGGGIIITGGSTNGTQGGGDVAILGGLSGGSTIGSSVSVTGGTGGATGAGGHVTVKGGQAGGGNQNGGDLRLRGGIGAGTGFNGIVYVGDSTTKEVHLGSGGTVVMFDGTVSSDIVPTADNTYNLGTALVSWASVNGRTLVAHGDTLNTHKVVIDTDNVTHYQPTGTGKLTVTSTQATTASAVGNEVAVVGGEGGNASGAGGGKGGQLTLTAGRGGSDSATKAAGAGGDVRITAGVGGPVPNAIGGNLGGWVYITGGAGSTGSPNSQTGGSVLLTGGDGTGPAGGGGDVNINGGNKVGVGVEGRIYIGVTRAYEIRIGGGGTNPAIIFGGTGTVTGSAAKWDLSAATELDLPDTSTATFKLGATVQGANFTGANMAILFAGPASDASSLHTHSGLSSSSVDVSATAKEALVVGQPVLFMDDSGTAKVRLSDANAAGRKDCVGLCSLAAAGDGSATKVRTSGEIGTTIGAGTYWDTDPVVGDVGKRVYISLTQGKLTYDVSGFTTSGDMILRVGWISKVDVGNAKAYVVLGVGEGVVV